MKNILEIQEKFSKIST